MGRGSPSRSGRRLDHEWVLDGEGDGIEVFTTRPDTLFGATFMVLAPEHPLVDALTPEGPWPEATKPGVDRRRHDPRGRRGIPS